MAEKRVIELEVKTNNKSLKSQLREAQAEVAALSEKFGATSQAAVEAAKKAAILKDTIGDAKALTDAFNPDAKFNALSSSIGGVLNGFQAFEGALGLVGVEGEAVQETMLKVQSAMAVSQGIQGLMEAKDSFKQLGAVAMNALKGIKTGIAATGIGLLVVALGTIVAYWDDIKSAVNGVSSEQEELNIKTEARFETSKKELNTLDAQDNVLKLQGKSEKEILKLKSLKVQETIKDGIAQLETQKITAKAQEQAAIRNFEIAKKIIAAITKIALIPVTAMIAQIDLLVKGANYVSEALGGKKLIDVEPLKEANKFFDQMAEKGAKFLFDPEQVKKDGKKLQEETKNQINELKNKKAGYDLAITEIDKQNQEKSNEIRNNELEKIKENNRQALADTSERLKTEQEKEEFAINQKFNAQIALAKKYNKDTTNLETEQANQINEIRLKYQQEEYAKKEELRKKELDAIKQANDLKIKQENEFQLQIEQIDEANFQNRLQKNMSEKDYELELVRQKYFELEEAAKGNAEQEKIIAEAKQSEIDKINEDYSQKEKERKQRARDFAIESAQQSLSVVQGLTELFAQKGLISAKKAFNIAKAANIASATIDTFKSATGAYASQMTVPDPSAPVRASIAAGIAVAAGLVNVAKIASQKFEGGGSTGGSSAPSAAGLSGAGGVSAPSFNVIGSSGVNQLAQIQQQPTRAYVVSGDIANGMSLERNRLQTASL